MWPLDYCATCADWQFDQDARCYLCYRFRVNKIPDRDRLCGGRYKVLRKITIK